MATEDPSANNASCATITNFLKKYGCPVIEQAQALCNEYGCLAIRQANFLYVIGRVLADFFNHVKPSEIVKKQYYGATAMAAVALFTSVATAAAGERSSTHSARIQVCALLPDTISSTRWVQFDKPYLTTAFKDAGVSATIYNAQGNAKKQLLQAEKCLANGAQVILLVPLDPESGTTITNIVVRRGAKVIDYDRLVPGSKALYYVSFHPLKVGVLLGKGLVAALKKNGKYSQMPVIAELNGAITDNNAILFKQGYDSVLDPLYNAGTFKKAIDGDQWTEWDPLKALTIFEQMLTLNSNQIDGVLAANDRLAGSVVSALKKSELDPVALTGQDATARGVQFILAGLQSGTVYKPIKSEAAAAVKVAISIINRKRVVTNGMVSGTPSVLLTPSWITKANYKMLFSDGFLKKVDVCKAIYAKYCT